MSNERSASDPNLIWNGHEINHQWSKGVEAEGLLRAALAGHAGLAEPYFSLLRPLSELHIARLFARFTRYDDVVTSCNAAFKLRDAERPLVRRLPQVPVRLPGPGAVHAPPSGWCRSSARDLLADPAQVPGYLELLGIDAHKPFECVGEVEESVVALGPARRAPATGATPPVVRTLPRGRPGRGVERGDLHRRLHPVRAALRPAGLRQGAHGDLLTGPRS